MNEDFILCMMEAHMQQKGGEHQALGDEMLGVGGGQHDCFAHQCGGIVQPGFSVSAEHGCRKVKSVCDVNVME